MTDLERLQLLKVVAIDAEIDTCPGMGKLANDLESLRSMLEVVSERFRTSFSAFWAALEVVAVQHQEDGSEPTQEEKNDLNLLKIDFLDAVDYEIKRRIS